MSDTSLLQAMLAAKAVGGGGGGGGFTPTTEQLAAMNSGITSTDVTQIGTNASDISTLQTSKQDTITFNTAYSASTNKAATMSDIPSASSADPQPLGTAAAGSSSDFSRADHVHALPANATTSAAGLMSATDKTNLNSCVTNIAKLISEIKTINISDITWTASGQGMYYSSEISLNSIKTILGWCFVQINGLKSENWLLVSQNTTSLGKFRLLAGSDNFYSEAQVKIRLYGTTDELT